MSSASNSAVRSLRFECLYWCDVILLISCVICYRHFIPDGRRHISKQLYANRNSHIVQVWRRQSWHHEKGDLIDSVLIYNSAWASEIIAFIFLDCKMNFAHCIKILKCWFIVGRLLCLFAMEYGLLPTVVTHRLGRCFADTDTHFSH